MPAPAAQTSLSVTLPRLTTERWYPTLSERLESAVNARDKVVLDASKVVWISPFGTILLADFARRRLESGLTTSIAMPQHNTSREYIRDSGLLNLTTSSNLNDAINSNNVQLRLLKQMEGGIPELLADFASAQAKNVNDNDKALLQVWITELLTNANDHAQSKSGFWICARYNPNPIYKDIRICVADSGIGIKGSLLHSGKYGTEMTHAQAIEKALEEGVTSRPGRTGGLGLKHIAAYVKAHGGSLTIFSGDARIHVARKKKQIKPIRFYQGTIVTAAFDVRTMSNLGGSHESAESPFQFE